MIDYPLHAYAIVCENDCIADAEGRFPDVLRNDADWLYFQSGLDRAAITLMGRRSHETNANHRNRLRLVMSRSVSALEHRADGWWWNPAERPLPEALQTIIPEGGEVAVPGGRDVFDLLEAASFTAFHLARAHGRTIPRGRGLFQVCETGTPSDLVLLDGGLRPGPMKWLDEENRVSLTVWRRRAEE
jgi:hypothetical protein